MTKGYVEIPANTLIHVGGFPFLIVQPVRVVGTSENLAEALAAVGDGAANMGSDAQHAG